MTNASTDNISDSLLSLSRAKVKCEADLDMEKKRTLELKEELATLNTELSKVSLENSQLQDERELLLGKSRDLIGEADKLEADNALRSENVKRIERKALELGEAQRNEEVEITKIMNSLREKIISAKQHYSSDNITKRSEEIKDLVKNLQLQKEEVLYEFDKNLSILEKKKEDCTSVWKIVEEAIMDKL